MKQNLIFLLLFFITLSLSAQVKEDKSIPNTPKIGLSLSGGGAKGFAHVGVLKVLDSLGVKIDYISGTSMGAIIGGLYASGYSGKEIEKMVSEIDFFSVLANEKNRKESSFFNKATDKYILNIPIKNGKFILLPKAYSKGQKNIFLLKDLFRNVANVDDFSTLPIPFMCVATNLENGKMKLFEHGDLVNSIMASTAFPGLIDPIKVGDSLYIDGAITLNYPSKPLKDKGMDIVIGVDLNQGLADSKKINSAIDILNQVIDFNIQKETQKQYEYTDINIKPNLDGITATSYNEKEKIVNLGFNEAKKYDSKLSLLPKKVDRLQRITQKSIYSNVYKIDSLTLVNNSIFNQSYVKGKLGLKTPSFQTYGSINKMIERLYATNNYDLISYDIKRINDKQILELKVTEDDNRYFLKFGLHYDEVFHTGLLTNLTIKRLLFRNSIITLDAVIGDNPRYYFNYFIDNGYIPGFGLYSTGMSFDLKNQYGDKYEKWIWLRNEAFIQSNWRDKFMIGGGISFDYFNSKDVFNYNIENKTFLNPYIFIKSDTQDDVEFPTKGFYLNAEGKILDILNTQLEKKALQSKAKIQFNIPINRWLTYRMNMFGGFTIGNNLSTFYEYKYGGIFEQNIANFSAFDGLYFGQKSTSNLLSAASTIQFNYNKKFFFSGHFNLLNAFESIKMNEIFRIQTTSIGLTVGYKSLFGQIKMNYSKNNLDGNRNFNIILGHWF
ncbi:MAG: patatin-like phospholipase family protein [Bacteroidetes bacterium]|nr:patatin-like phospholipase family protein [Bacteroidota bacterium]